MLGRARLTAFLATADPARSKPFFERTLGLRCVADDPFALVFDCNGTDLRIQKVTKVHPPPFTVLGWQVPNIREAVQGLGALGVAFERFASLEQDALGIWTAPSQTKVAWFKDPDGHILSLAEGGAAAPLGNR